MNLATQFALFIAAGAVFVLLLERHTVVPQLAAERARAQQFASVIAECANGRAFTIADTLVKCKPVAAKQ